MILNMFLEAVLFIVPLLKIIFCAVILNVTSMMYCNTFITFYK